MILSIDVGTVNLALCLYDETNGHIEKWDVEGIPSNHTDGIPRTLCKHLDERPWTLTADVVLIERQPERSKKMIAVMHFLEAYYIVKLPNAIVLLWDARHKVPDVVGAGKKMYRLRKNTAIERCKDLIENGPEINRHWMEFFNKSRKKDDLADTVLQAISYGRPQRVVQANTANANKKLTARKPTENQIRTKYSKSNIVWLYKNTPLDDFKKDKRFQRDLKKHFRNIEELQNNIN